MLLFLIFFYKVVLQIIDSFLIFLVSNLIYLLLHRTSSNAITPLSIRVMCIMATTEFSGILQHLHKIAANADLALNKTVFCTLKFTFCTCSSKQLSPILLHYLRIILLHSLILLYVEYLLTFLTKRTFKNS